MLPKNIGEVVYSQRYRAGWPEEIKATISKGRDWIIVPAGRGRYSFKLIRGSSRILPRLDAAVIKVPDATPKIIAAYAQSDEQAVLARVRYNRLIDIFLGITAYSLQNHFRTSVKDMGQIEIDELYVGVNREGQQFIVPVQAKGGSDQLSIIQAIQDIACCCEKFPLSPAVPFRRNSWRMGSSPCSKCEKRKMQFLAWQKRGITVWFLPIKSKLTISSGIAQSRKSAVDRVTRKIRSRIMVSVRSRNGTAEVRMASTLRSSGLHGYRRHWPVAGTPILHGRA
ncbi:MAG TPA: hypothetical protein VFA71_02810 [Terriglobales bacterium]|nr:hypothetical protein [Terriglobales bacterium]